jgi:hypothetical protein
MNKERQPIYESGYSEKEMDQAMDKTQNLNQVKAGNIFDPAKKQKDPNNSSKNQ